MTDLTITYDTPDDQGDRVIRVNGEARGFARPIGKDKPWRIKLYPYRGGSVTFTMYSLARARASILVHFMDGRPQ